MVTEADTYVAAARRKAPSTSEKFPGWLCALITTALTIALWAVIVCVVAFAVSVVA